MKFYKMLKRWDWIILIILIAISFLPSAVFSYHQSNISEEANVVARISINNEVVKEVTLTGHEGTEILHIPQIPAELNAIEVSDGKIRMPTANCPDQICVLTGYISQPGETIVCLYNQVVVEIVSTGNVDAEDDDLLSF